VTVDRRGGTTSNQLPQDAAAARQRQHGRMLRQLTAAHAAGGAVARQETWHRGDKSGALRAGVFGVNDGLVSNASLVMGFAGSGAASSTVLLAGVAGLVAGAFSMAAGEYVSMASQRELFERELAVEREEIATMPEQETTELALLYEGKGLKPEEAAQVAERVMADPETALDAHAREELGLDPDELGSPWRAAAASFLAFGVGAFVVVLPYLLAAGTTALVAAVAAAVVALLAVGAGIGRLTGRSVLRGAARQLLVGGLAAAATYGVGALLGVSTA
jgi:VIT1/CCC1 family predicted Fe2+/Mn2+ transporter